MFWASRSQMQAGHFAHIAVVYSCQRKFMLCGTSGRNHCFIYGGAEAGG